MHMSIFLDIPSVALSTRINRHIHLGKRSQPWRVLRLVQAEIVLPQRIAGASPFPRSVPLLFGHGTFSINDINGSMALYVMYNRVNDEDEISRRGVHLFSCVTCMCAAAKRTEAYRHWYFFAIHDYEIMCDVQKCFVLMKCSKHLLRSYTHFSHYFTARGLRLGLGLALIHFSIIPPRGSVRVQE